MNDDMWWEYPIYNNDYDDLNYRNRVYEGEKSIFLPNQKSITEEDKILLRSIEI